MKNNLFAGADDRAQAKRRDTIGFEIPATPTVCTKSSCRKDAFIAFAVVTDAGQTKVGPASMFISHSRVLKQGVEWVKWIARCPECYTDDLVRSGRDPYEALRK